MLGAGYAATTMGDKAPSETKAEPEAAAPEPIDVSIPYNAASLLAYDAWRIEGDRGDFDQASYDKFEAIYITKTVAEVTAKKAIRELAALA